MLNTPFRFTPACGAVLLLLCAAAGTTSTMPTQSTPDDALAFQGGGAAPREMLVYVGTYANADAKGIHAFKLDLTTGKLTPAGSFVGGPNPGFVAIHPSGKYLYAINEVGEYQGKKTGSVTSFSIGADGGLTKLNEADSFGPGPCHVTVDRRGKNVLLANYGGGSVAVLPIAGDGKLKPPSSGVQHTGSSVDKGRQEAPHAHSINVSPDNRFAFAADLGLDAVRIYKFNADTGQLDQNDPPEVKVAPGSGPRHFAFHPDGKRAYVINEMKCTLTAFEYDAKTGALRETQTLPTTPDGVQRGYSTAEVQVHPNGRFVYGSNRGAHTIAIFSVAGDGKMAVVGHQPTGGRTPRNFGIDPTGTFLLAANQDTNDIHVFRIDRDTGKLTPTGEKVSVPKPVCVKFLPR
jgi:6-phosphogluconolactonase